MITLYHVDAETDWMGGARPAAKARIALLDAGADFEEVYLDRKRDMRNPSSEFRRNIDPWDTLPVIVDDDFILRESGAILRYIAEGYLESKLLPETRRERALVDQWLSWEATTFLPALVGVFRLGLDDDDDRLEHGQELYEANLNRPGMRAAQARTNEHLKILDAQLSGREYVNDSYSLADIALGCQLPVATAIGMDLKPFPNIVSWLSRLELRTHGGASRASCSIFSAESGRASSPAQSPSERRLASGAGRKSSPPRLRPSASSRVSVIALEFVSRLGAISRYDQSIEPKVSAEISHSTFAHVANR